MITTQSPLISQSIRVGLVEDEATIRDDLCLLLKSCSELKLVGSFSNAEAAIKDAVRYSPEVMLVDINLPGMDGIECVRTLRPAMPATQFLMLTVYEDSERILDSLRAGAVGYLVKRCTRSQIVEAIKDAAQGGAPMSSHIARKVVQYFSPASEPKGKQTASDCLSTREKEVLDALSRGLLYKEVATKLDISLDTVRRHVSNIYSKLQVHSRTQAVVKYLIRQA